MRRREGVEKCVKFSVWSVVQFMSLRESLFEEIEDLKAKLMTKTDELNEAVNPKVRTSV